MEHARRHAFSFARAALALALALGLAGCGLLPPADDDTEERLGASDWARESQPDGTAQALPWTHQRFGQRKATRYRPRMHQGRPAVLADSDNANSVLRQRLGGVAVRPGDRVAFSWLVPELNPEADLREPDTDDVIACIVLAFDGDRDRLGARDHLLSELVLLVTGEPLPYATLLYVWDPHLPVGTVTPGHHSARVRALVVESGPGRTGRWLDYERDIDADFRQAFGEAPGPLINLGVMTDSNHTGHHSQAWFGPLRLIQPHHHRATR